MGSSSRSRASRAHGSYIYGPGASRFKYAPIPSPIVVNYSAKYPAPVVNPWWQKSHETLKRESIQPIRDAFAAKRRVRSHSDDEEVKERVVRSVKRRRYKSCKPPGLDFDIPSDFSDGSDRSWSPSPSSRGGSPIPAGWIPVDDNLIFTANTPRPPPSPGFEPKSTIVTLPRFLARPKFRKYQLENLTRINPELEGIPIEYVQDGIEAHGDKFLAVLRGVRCPPPKGRRLPKDVRVVCENLETAAPTHMLAVYSKLTQLDERGRRRVTLFPTHDLVLHAHCANLPQLPLSPNNPNLEEGWWHTIPLVPLCIPFPHVWPMMSHYLYTRDPDHFFNAVFPSKYPDPFEQPMDAVDEDGNNVHVVYAWQLSQQYTAAELVDMSEKIAALWRNTVVLGIQDEKWWAIMDYAWEVYLVAISYSTETPEKMGLEPRED